MERLVQSVKALCSSLAAVETPDVTSALNQLPACPCRLQPKVLKVSEAENVSGVFRGFYVEKKKKTVTMSCLSSQDASVLAVRENRGTNQQEATTGKHLQTVSDLLFLSETTNIKY